jgi:hypothetical protein
MRHVELCGSWSLGSYEIAYIRDYDERQPSPSRAVRISETGRFVWMYLASPDWDFVIFDTLRDRMVLW